MAIPQMTDDLNIIGSLGDNPNTDNGLSPEELKAKFDEAAKLIQNFLNLIMIPEVNAIIGAVGFKGTHGELTGRDASNQHPMSAINGLAAALDKKAASVHNHNADQINEGVFSTDRIPVVPISKGGTGAGTAANARKALDITPANIGALPSSGGKLTGAVTMKGMHLTSGVDYGDSFPTSGLTEGRLFFIAADSAAAAELG